MERPASGSGDDDRQESPANLISQTSQTSDTSSSSTSRDRLDSLGEFSALAVTEILDQDSRPTFVIDLDPDDDAPLPLTGLAPLFCNSALCLHEQLLDVITGNCSEAESATGAAYQDFKSWATGVTKHDDSKDCFPLSFLYADMLWTGSTVRKRWRLVSGNLWNTGLHVHETSLSLDRQSHGSFEDAPMTPPAVATADTLTTSTTTTLVGSKQHPETSNPLTNSSSTGESSQTKTVTLGAPERACPDWTVRNPKGLVSDHIAIARAVNWEATSLGPMDHWSPEFRQLVNLLMNNPFPASIFWGADLTMLYNEAYANELAGLKHPNMMGTCFSGPFSEAWEVASGPFSHVARTGIAFQKEDECIPIHRHGFLEECFFSWSLTPLHGGTKKILGFYNVPFETTKTVLAKRRMETVNRVGSNLSRARGIKQFWKLLLDALDDSHYDIPFALVYSVGDSEENDMSSVSSGSSMSMKTCFYEGSIGIPENHVAAPRQLDLKRSREGFIPAFREAIRTREPTLLHTRDGSLPKALLEGIEWRGSEDPCSQAIIFPVRPTEGDTILAFLVVGVNPRRPYDDAYKAFTSMLNRQLATSLASFMLFEEEMSRSRYAAEAAALEAQQLSQQLAVQTDRLRRMTELSPLGMFLIDPDGVLREGNDRYFEMTGHPRHEKSEKSWRWQIEDSSLETSETAWHTMAVDHQPWTGELQMKKLLVNPIGLNGEDIDYWVMVNAQPEFTADGSLRSIMGSITDISSLKWAQGLQNRRLKESEETRRQQNEFIDITSHEMRNPLSAILQCADDISATLMNHRARGSPPSREDVEGCMEAANTISVCVQHQKSIVDDILTVSKLDSNLLLITPIVARPAEVVERAVKIFEPELQAKDIRMSHEDSLCLGEVVVDWANFDPSRVLQILINLITNAIKFTAASTTRNITVSVGVSREPPLQADTPNFQYIPPKTISPNLVAGEEWGNEEVLYFSFLVRDTGCGLTPEEIKILFTRFSQASPRTHAQYGGSGLGLFISRQLAELHGGQIGVASEAGVGSSFGFFIAARKATRPAVDTQTELTAKVKRQIGRQQSFVQQVLPTHQDPASASLGADLAAPKAAPEFNPRDLEVLVVEDNLVNQTVLVKQLKKQGIGVNAANDGIEALAFLDSTIFRRADGKRLSVILMDLEMPNMDGVTCVREIRKMQQSGAISGHVPVIAVTANVRDEQIAETRKAGMDDVVSKPFRISQLLKKIEILLREVSNGNKTLGGSFMSSWVA
ncbi:Uu.00g039630.m01.CDS01 [Anthostomella pinea]|uniref:histidine kinase n=1 Tax=Anthostomella pinea TaxID=933095 RepID=A0AAI8VA17_9PEZI|nr:Uu.00g039630.m01.CDS01 [Anthostomella pinea]